MDRPVEGDTIKQRLILDHKMQRLILDHSVRAQSSPNPNLLPQNIILILTWR